MTVTEVRPGETQEEYVTSGFLRSSDRTLSRRLDGARPGAHLPDGGSPEPAPRALHPRPDADRPDRAHVPGRDPAAHRHLGPGRGPPVVDLRHAGHPRHGGRHGGLGGRRARRWWSTRSAGWSRPPALPACGALRGEPCRAYAPLEQPGLTRQTSRRPRAWVGSAAWLGRRHGHDGQAARRGLALRGTAHHAGHPALHRRAGPRRGAARHPLRRHPGAQRVEPPALPLHRPHRRAGGAGGQAADRRGGAPVLGRQAGGRRLRHRIRRPGRLAQGAHGPHHAALRRHLRVGARARAGLLPALPPRPLTTPTVHRSTPPARTCCWPPGPSGSAAS